MTDTTTPATPNTKTEWSLHLEGQMIQLLKMVASSSPEEIAEMYRESVSVTVLYRMLEAAMGSAYTKEFCETTWQQLRTGATIEDD